MQETMRRDQRRIAGLARQSPAAAERLRSASAAQLAQRRQIHTRLEYPPELPITAAVAEIRSLLDRHQVVIVAGETGSGKTTQLPKVLLEAGFGRTGMIGHTQPRRLAARTVAARIAEELGVPLGGAVGYAVRFSDQTGPETLVKVVTDGLLLTEIRQDRALEAYDALIVDEAHERTLNIDFLLGYLKGLCRRRPEFKLIVTSATIDVQAFADYFDGAPIVTVSGRGYPVESRYLDEQDVDRPLTEQVLETLEEIDRLRRRGGARDVLVFLPGERDILDLSRDLRRQLGSRYEILPLYARLSAREQARIFEAGQQPRVVLSTNVAETSLTVPNIGYVIDTGLARISRYSFRSKLQRLPVEAISQASADQRQGRCGRVAPGVCFRLFTEADFRGRPEYTDPEIRRTNLASVALQMLAFGLGDLRRFPFIDPPEEGAVGDALRLLEELGALENGRISPMGRLMARLPVDPRLARMVVEADRQRSLTELLVITAALAVQDPRERPLQHQAAADAAHAPFADKRSDFMSWLQLWDWAENQRQALTRRRFERLLKNSFLNPARMREWRDVHRQLRLAVRELGLRENTERADYPSIHQAILAGSLSLIGLHDEKGRYLGPRQLKFRIFPGSALADARPRWLVAAEITETQRVYARCVAGVEPGWIESLAGDLVKRRYNDPHWSAKRGEAFAYERVTLYGLPLVERRRKSLTRQDPQTARELLLTDGLVRGGMPQLPAFLQANLADMAAAEELEAKGRRRDLLLAEAEIAAFYDERLPKAVCSYRLLQAWLRRSPDNEGLLRFPEGFLYGEVPSDLGESAYPDRLQLAGTAYRLRYRFAPGTVDDGVTLEVPLGALAALPAAPLEWLVPGLFPALLEQWLKSLPKNRRRQLAPVPDRAAELLPRLLRADTYREGRLLVALQKVLADVFGLTVSAQDWRIERIPPHLQMNVQVLDEHGKVLNQGRDLVELQAQFRAALNERLAEGAAGDLERTQLTRFPKDVEIGGRTVLATGLERTIGFPGIEDHVSHCDVRVLPTPAAQAQANRRGYPRLASFALRQLVGVLRRDLARETELGLQFAPVGPAEALTEQLVLGVLWYALFEGEPLPADAAAFEARLADRRGRIAGCFQEVLGAVRAIYAARFQVMRRLAELDAPTLQASREAIRRHAEALAPPDLLLRVRKSRLADIPRYLQALQQRADNLQGRVVRDQQLQHDIDGFRERLAAISHAEQAAPALVEDLRFEIEELAVACFAERLKRGKVSPQRLDRRFQAVERELGLR